MQLKQLITASLFTAVAAQNQASVDAFSSAGVAYLQSLVSDAGFISQLLGLATVDSAIILSLQQLATGSLNAAELTTPPGFITALPSPYNSIFNSVYTYEVGLASQYGLISGGSLVTGTPSPVAPAASTAPTASTAPAASTTHTASTPHTASSLPSQVNSGVSSISTAAASSTPSTVLSKAGAAPTGVTIMGLAAGAIGVVAALL